MRSLQRVANKSRNQEIIRESSYYIAAAKGSF